MSTDPKDKELTGKEAEDVQAGRTQDDPRPESPHEPPIVTPRELSANDLNAVKGGRTQPPKRE